jgi:hypothetical protein
MKTPQTPLTVNAASFYWDSANKSPSLFKLEDGWMAYKLIGKYIAIVFEGPDQESARQILQKNESNLLKKEN